jgi:hypothetical protein
MPNNLEFISIFAGPWFCPLSMLEEVIGDMGRRGITFTSYARQADSSVVQHRAAEAALKIEGARVQALRAVDEMHELSVARTPSLRKARSSACGEMRTSPPATRCLQLIRPWRSTGMLYCA